MVSVPLQGTYLPYPFNASMMRYFGMSFRPLTGDLSSLLTFIFVCVRKWLVSVPLQGTYLPYSKGNKYADQMKAFPSPYRGLIFLTKFSTSRTAQILVSVPLQGTYLPYTEKSFNDYSIICFRPLTGDLSSLLV